MIDWKTGKRLRDVSVYLTHREASYMLEFLEFAVANPTVDDHTHIWSRDSKDTFSFEIVTSRKLKAGYSPKVRRLCRGWVDDWVRPKRKKKAR